MDAIQSVSTSELKQRGQELLSWLTDHDMNSKSFHEKQAEYRKVSIELKRRHDYGKSMREKGGIS